MARRKISSDAGEHALVHAMRALDSNTVPAREHLATSVRFLLEELAQQHPGNTLEVRVPPFGAVQCVEGPKHTRGTPPNVVECDALTWISLATGRSTWHEAVTTHRASASGTRATLEGLVPLITQGSMHDE